MNPLIIIAGPTAVGKSALAVQLAKRIKGSVISADSMQVYKGMDIGTAKITTDEMQGIPHYLIDVLEPSESFNVVKFKEMAEDAIGAIKRSGRIPIMVGGTGFYIQSVLYDIDFDETFEDDGTRSDLWDIIATKGAGFVRSILEKEDPKAAAMIHENDHKRMIRAIEYHRQTNKLISEHNVNCAKISPYDALYFFLEDDRDKIYERINRRVDDMVSAGLCDEVSHLRDIGLKKEDVSMQGIGYKQIMEYLDGECTLEDAIYRIKRDSRHFAKRQITWSKREKDIIRIDIRQADVLDKLLNEIRKKGIINEQSV